MNNLSLTRFFFICLIFFVFLICVESKRSNLFSLNLKEQTRHVEKPEVIGDQSEQLATCVGHKCGPGRMCTIDTNTKKPTCICITECNKNNDVRRKVCSNYNTTWQSDCHLHRQRCLCEEGLSADCTEKHKHMHIDYYGECTDNIKCEPEVLEDFPRRMREWLFNILTSEHTKLQSISPQEDLAHKWVDAVIWKYCDLDKEPSDRFVSRHELFPLRAPLLSIEPCISDFLNQCDVNSDHQITLKEWGHCLGADEAEIQDKCLKFKSIIHKENDYQP